MLHVGVAVTYRCTIQLPSSGCKRQEGVDQQHYPYFFPKRISHRTSLQTYV
jgi:hypothetical protein